MLPVEHQSYVPVLRLKQGEYLAFTEIASDVATRLLPHLILPPPTEVDPEKRRTLTSDEIIYENGQRLGKYWPRRTCLVDTRFLFKKLGESESSKWLPRLFKVATDAEARPMPVVALADVEGIRFDGFGRIIDARNVGVAIRLTLRDLGDKNLKERLQGALLKMVALPSQCILLLDLSGADLSSADPVGEYIVAAFQRVYEIGNWRRVVVEATSYPESNPAREDGEILLPRNEWKAWKLAVAHDATIRQQLAFGDFGADSSKFVFSSGAIAQIRHYRYSTEDHWLVVRGNKAADALTAMRGVASRIVESKHFAGRDFSQADEYIFETAAGRQKKPGSAMIWRKVNTVHHLTRVANDLGSMYGYAVVRLSEHSPPRQIDMFPQTN